MEDVPSRSAGPKRTKRGRLSRSAEFERVYRQGRSHGGRHFVLHDPTPAIAYWRDRLPDTPIIVEEDAGQLLAYSHPNAVVAALGN